jgi:uncharacterized protein (DUF2336 family)
MADTLLEELENALASGTPEQRLQRLWRVTDLFVTGTGRYADEQIELFDGVILRLAEAIEASARAELARRLARLADAPRKLMSALAWHDDIAVAGPVLTHSERLCETDLVGTAQTKSQEHLLAIAQRASLSEAVTDVLVARGDRRVVRSVVKNEGARFSGAGFRTLVRKAIGDDSLAVLVGARRDLPRRHLLDLIDKASAAARRRLAAAHPQAASAVEEVLSEIRSGIRAEVRRVSTHCAAAEAAVEALHRTGRLSEAQVYEFAQQDKFEETVVALSLMCGVGVGDAERALLDKRYEPVLFLTKVAGLSWPTTQAILLLRADEHGLSAHDLNAALTSFTRLQPATAVAVLRMSAARTHGAERKAPARAAGALT